MFFRAGVSGCVCQICRPKPNALPVRVFQKLPRLAVRGLGLLLALALLRDLVSNSCPLVCRIGGETFFPAFRTVFEPHEQVRWPAPLAEIARNDAWREAKYEWSVFPPVAFRPGASGNNQFGQPPLAALQVGCCRTFRHWLGTDGSGRDVAAGMVAGCRVALLTALVAMGMALAAGGLLGGLAGYFGDDRLRLRRGLLWANLLALPVAVFFALVPRWFFLTYQTGQAEWLRAAAVFAIIFLIFNGLAWALCRWAWWAQRVTVPADFAIMRLADVFDSVPRLLLVVALAAISASGVPPVLWVVGIIGLFSWPDVARLLRAELLRVRELEFIQAARALGFSDWHVLRRHALPNALRPVLVAVSLGAAGAILLEAGLAFLGFTSGAAGASWGSLLHEARNHMTAWWTAVFPGLALCWTLLAFHALGDALAEGNSLAD